MNKTLDTLYCAECGSCDIEMKMWVNPNTSEINGNCSDRTEEEDNWCRRCEEHVRLLTLKEMWKCFSEVPINNNDEIEEHFLCFETGTKRFDIWRWFADRCPNGGIMDLLGEY